MDEIQSNIFDKISYYIVQADKFKDSSGKVKKEYVLRKVKSVLDQATFEVYEVMISDFIDFLIKVSKNKKFLKHINNKSQGIFNICLE